MAEKPKPPTRDEWAAKYGLALALINSDRSKGGLKDLFDSAVKEKWNADRFIAQMRKTKWYTTHAEQWRQTEALRLTDRKSYDANVAQQVQGLRNLAVEMGARLSEGQIKALGESYYRMGYSDPQARAALAQYISAGDDDKDAETPSTYVGGAAAVTQQLRAVAEANGQSYSDKWYLDAARAVGGGAGDINTYMAQIRADAAGTYGVYKDRILAGEDVVNIASNYIQRYAQMLEVDPESVSLTDKHIDAALNQTTPDGKPSVQSITDFTKTLKQDPRWAKTDNARDEISKSMYSVGRLMGFA